MLKASEHNLGLLTIVAKQLGSLLHEVVFCVGNIFFGLVNDNDFIDALPGHLLPDESSQARLSIIQNRIEQLATMT